MAKPNFRPKTSTLEQERAALLREALARPGVREVMRVYGLCQEQDKGLNAYRAATRKSFETITTNRTNAR